VAKVDFIQTSFAGGEFGPDIFGRTDIASYQNACKTVENFIVRSYGPVISMPGTTYIGTVSSSTTKCRLIKFVFNRNDSYVIEMGPLYFRFYTNQGIVITTGTTPFHLAHVYTESEIEEVQFNQLNDVIWLTHKNHPPQRLIRRAAASWTISDFPFLGGPFLDENVPDITSSGVTASTITITASATAGTINITVSPTNSSLFTVSGSTLGHKNSYWMIGGLAQTNSTTGLQEMGYVKITYVTNSYTATATVLKNLKATTATTHWAEGAWNSVRGYPASVTLHERRLWFARTNYEPQKLWGSKVFEYDNFSLDTQADDDGMNLDLASNESNEIQWLSSGKSLIAGTFGGAFVVNSGSSEPITPSNANASEQIGFGSSSIAPKRIGNFLYYAQRFGKKIREMFYVWDLDTYKAVDRTILSPHILGEGVREMDVMQNPESVLFCVLTNGTLATMTREQDQDVTAWARQVTDGTYTSIAIIPSQSFLYDEVWVIVERWINGVQKKYIEVFDPLEPPQRQDYCNYLHSTLFYDAFDTTTTSTILISLSATAGSVTITASGPAFTQAHVGKRIRTMDPLDGTIWGEGTITATAGTTGCTITCTLAFDAVDYSGGEWGISVTTLSGLDHLEEENVSVLADGGTDKPSKVVSSGSITLANDYFVVAVGLPYDQKLRLLPKELGSVRGTSQGKKQRINEVAFKLYRSHRGFYVGGTETELDVVSYIESTTEEIYYTGTIPNPHFILQRISSRDPSTLMGMPEVLFSGVVANITFQDDYQYGSEIFIKNSDPLPVEFISIIGTLDTFDK
jgi:hypothetical protein